MIWLRMWLGRVFLSVLFFAVPGSLVLTGLMVTGLTVTSLVTESEAADSRVLIVAKGRQLRSVTVEAKGYAGPGAGATVAEKRAAALALARREAVGKVRKALDAEIQGKRLELEFDFPGKAPEEAVFVLQSVDLPETRTTQQGVRIRAQVIYVLVFPAALTAFQDGGVKPLGMRSAGQSSTTAKGVEGRIEERDNNYLEQFLMLEKGLKKKLDGMLKDVKDAKE
jgi:hypothetical protein